MNIVETPLDGLIVIEPKVFGDQRGYFLESYQQTRYQSHQIPPFVQDNASRSTKGTLRGLHYQLQHPQGKLVFVTRGIVWDVAVDLRRSSKTFGQWYGIELSDSNLKQMYVPPGFAHGFCVLSDEADFYYKCTDYYSPESELGIIWNDSALNISWPTQTPILSDKDKLHPEFESISHEKLFT